MLITIPQEKSPSGTSATSSGGTGGSGTGGAGTAGVSSAGSGAKPAFSKRGPNIAEIENIEKFLAATEAAREFPSANLTASAPASSGSSSPSMSAHPYNRSQSASYSSRSGYGLLQTMAGVASPGSTIPVASNANNVNREGGAGLSSASHHGRAVRQNSSPVSLVPRMNELLQVVPPNVSIPADTCSDLDSLVQLHHQRRRSCSGGTLHPGGGSGGNLLSDATAVTVSPNAAVSSGPKSAGSVLHRPPPAQQQQLQQQQQQQQSALSSQRRHPQQSFASQHPQSRMLLQRVPQLHPGSVHRSQHAHHPPPQLSPGARTPAVTATNLLVQQLNSAPLNQQTTRQTSQHHPAGFAAGFSAQGNEAKMDPLIQQKQQQQQQPPLRLGDNPTARHDFPGFVGRAPHHQVQRYPQEHSHQPQQQPHKVSRGSKGTPEAGAGAAARIGDDPNRSLLQQLLSE